MAVIWQVSARSCRVMRAPLHVAESDSAARKSLYQCNEERPKTPRNSDWRSKMFDEYRFQEIETKWQFLWEQENTHRASDKVDKPKFYVMEMFPYPSGAGLHGGHVKNYVPTDAFCRYKAMNGFNVLYPTGWDAFGQPAENEAIKRGRNPKVMVQDYADNFRSAMKRLGLSYDWTR